MAIDFARYLLAKQTVDDRALNKDVLRALTVNLAGYPRDADLIVLEIGGGIGTMLVRLLRWNVLPPRVIYILLDVMPGNIAYARDWLPRWAAAHGWQVAFDPQGVLSLENGVQTLKCHLRCADLFDYVDQNPPQAHLLIAHAVLDLLPIPETMQKITRLLRPGGLAWLTLNFDGVTIFQPELTLSDLQLSGSVLPRPAPPDSYIISLYHQTMRARSGGGDSEAGRRLLCYFVQSGIKILAAGASDWVVYPQGGSYPADEAYFLQCILHFFEESLSRHPALNPSLLLAWLEKRRAQIDAGQLIYIAHQMDFLIAYHPAPEHVT
jgi:Spermidine synthase